MKVAIAFVLAGTFACAQSSRRDPGWEERAAEMAGEWLVRLDFSGDSVRRASGTMALTANRSIDHPVDDMATPEDYGAYAIDFRALGFAPSGTLVPGVFVGRAVPDSIDVLFETNRPTFSLRMRGVLRGDSVNGRWRATESRNVLASGTFVMIRK